MKRSLVLFCLLFMTMSAWSQNSDKKIHVPDSTKKILAVEASCGQCKFGLKDKKGCDLAVRIDGKAYFVEGTSIDDHGDAHATDGFCSAIRRAEVQGKIVNNRFKATYFKLLPDPLTPQKTKTNR